MKLLLLPEKNHKCVDEKLSILKAIPDTVRAPAKQHLISSSGLSGL